MVKATKDQVDQSTKGTRPKTRDRILQVARELFNEHGEANVTLAHIGEHLGISEGNVWYHFRTKNAVISAIFMELKAKVQANQQRDVGDLRQVSQLQDLLTRGFHLMWEYRFLLRDNINWAVAQQDVYAQLIALTNQVHIFIENALKLLCQSGILAIPEWQIPIVATNLWIINRYWIDYCQTRNGQEQITEQSVQEGIEQLRSIVFPYLTPLGRQILNRSDPMNTEENATNQA
ncbi:TetR family transcriptional regulator [Dictyobacter alpinus]|uniref:TetR family transcriptional regulator n=1 Tax=Dictyobacter alpinus TaxID=2014873 RepID=A0A402BAQ5_9CHLR|nr:TetR/AcrR family transcriptional regulator [Dictyobacter alpinus]GCE28380.1 TetR family transcriptional regulator [Dictyobacter alpinus]